jgi:dihydrofolate reductase
MDATTTCHMSISLDGYVAGPDQNLEHPLGRGGIELHRWHLDEPLNDADTRARDLLLRPRGAYVMGRNMFGPLRGSWQDDWRGWWGEEPPYHAPVFVLTHFEHDPIEMAGGTTFHFCHRRLRGGVRARHGSRGRPRSRHRRRRIHRASGAGCRRDRRARARLRSRPARRRPNAAVAGRRR